MIGMVRADEWALSRVLAGFWSGFWRKNEIATRGDCVFGLCRHNAIWQGLGIGRYAEKPLRGGGKCRGGGGISRSGGVLQIAQWFACGAFAGPHRANGVRGRLLPDWVPR